MLCVYVCMYIYIYIIYVDFLKEESNFLFNLYQPLFSNCCEMATVDKLLWLF